MFGHRSLCKELLWIPCPSPEARRSHYSTDRSGFGYISRWLLTILVTLLLFSFDSGVQTQTVNGTSANTTCNTSCSDCWRTTSTVRKLSLGLEERHICRTSRSCNHESSNLNLSLPIQQHPLQIQKGDVVELTLPFANVTWQLYETGLRGFETCNFSATFANFTGAPSSSVRIANLSPGVHFFIGRTATDPTVFCKLGLRLRVTVTTEDCNFDNTTRASCTGKGFCKLQRNSTQYRCQCCSAYSGTYCSEFNGCLSTPCQNGGNCTDVVAGLNANFSCNCGAFFTGQRCETPANYCSSNPCQNNGTCMSMPLERRHVCNCSKGFNGTNCETNINECAFHNCSENSTCIDGINGYKCECHAGWTGNFCRNDINECAQRVCLNNGNCTNLAGNFSCQCPSFLTGRYCETDLVDNCLSSPCQNNGTCKDVVGGYQCQCKNGFNGTTCELDLNECTSNPCDHNGASQCVDLPGDFRCVCIQGYTGKTCGKLINYCDPNPCTNGGLCVTSLNRYTCACPAGYLGKNCEEVADKCSYKPCKNEGTCTRTGDYLRNYACTCKPGWTGRNCTINIDECISSPCVNNGTCNDRINGYNCTCLKGWTGTHCEENIDVCKEKPCENNGNCTDLLSGLDYICHCAPGYSGKNCSHNIDECSTLNINCNNGRCIDLVNGHRCNCSMGWYGDFCDTDKDMCQLHPCQNGATCHNVNNTEGYVCTCVPGFTGFNCSININECSSQPCKHNGTCNDFTNYFNCSCLAGFTGKLCETEINECLSSPCRNNATCVDRIGAFSCTCAPGYTGHDCGTDINECDSHPCLNNGTCIDGLNMFSCNCTGGYFGSTCQTPVCSTHPCKNGSTCVQILDGYHCNCLPGFTGKHCDINIDECSSKPCLNNGHCIDRINGYTCNCSYPFSGNICSVHVCDLGICLNQGNCTQLQTGYKCSCPVNYNGTRCEIPIGPCSSNPCAYNGTCLEMGNTFSCKCAFGFSGYRCLEAKCPCQNQGRCMTRGSGTIYCQCLVGYSGTLCEHFIGDCRNQSLSCFTAEQCISTDYGYVCRCNPPFIGKQCNVFGGCARQPCGNKGTCTGSIDNTKCTCAPGYTGQFCQFDLNDCLSNPCLNGGTCREKQTGGFACFCSHGFYGFLCQNGSSSSSSFLPTPSSSFYFQSTGNFSEYIVPSLSSTLISFSSHLLPHNVTPTLTSSFREQLSSTTVVTSTSYSSFLTPLVNTSTTHLYTFTNSLKRIITISHTNPTLKYVETQSIPVSFYLSKSSLFAQFSSFSPVSYTHLNSSSLKSSLVIESKPKNTLLNTSFSYYSTKTASPATSHTEVSLHSFSASQLNFKSLGKSSFFAQFSSFSPLSDTHVGSSSLKPSLAIESRPKNTLLNTSFSYYSTETISPPTRHTEVSLHSFPASQLYFKSLGTTFAVTSRNEITVSFLSSPGLASDLPGNISSTLSTVKAVSRSLDTIMSDNGTAAPTTSVLNSSMHNLTSQITLSSSMYGLNRSVISYSGMHSLTPSGALSNVTSSADLRQLSSYSVAFSRSHFQTYHSNVTTVFSVRPSNIYPTTSTMFSSHTAEYHTSTRTESGRHSAIFSKTLTTLHTPLESQVLSSYFGPTTSFVEVPTSMASLSKFTASIGIGYTSMPSSFTIGLTKPDSVKKLDITTTLPPTSRYNLSSTTSHLQMSPTSFLVTNTSGHVLTSLPTLVLSSTNGFLHSTSKLVTRESLPQSGLTSGLNISSSGISVLTTLNQSSFLLISPTAGSQIGKLNDSLLTSLQRSNSAILTVTQGIQTSIFMTLSVVSGITTSYKGTPGIKSYSSSRNMSTISMEISGMLTLSNHSKQTSHQSNTSTLYTAQIQRTLNNFSTTTLKTSAYMSSVSSHYISLSLAHSTAVAQTSFDISNRVSRFRTILSNNTKLSVYSVRESRSVINSSFLAQFTKTATIEQLQSSQHSEVLVNTTSRSVLFSAIQSTVALTHGTLSVQSQYITASPLLLKSLHSTFPVYNLSEHTLPSSYSTTGVDVKSESVLVSKNITEFINKTSYTPQSSSIFDALSVSLTTQVHIRSQNVSSTGALSSLSHKSMFSSTSLIDSQSVMMTRMSNFSSGHTLLIKNTTVSFTLTLNASLTSSIISSSAINPCQSRPCLNGGTCEDSKGGLTYNCICKFGYSGVKCEKYHCPCQNQGRCVLGSNGEYECLCKVGFNGTFCENFIEDCRSHNCSNRGTCRERVLDGFVCHCDPSFFGEKCDKNSSNCKPNPCENGGICFMASNSTQEFKCLCPPGYQGQFCQFDFNECGSNPCLNNGTCREDKINTYTCLCPVGTSGKQCEYMASSSVEITEHKTFVSTSVSSSLSLFSVGNFSTSSPTSSGIFSKSIQVNSSLKQKINTTSAPPLSSVASHSQDRGNVSFSRYKNLSSLITESFSSFSTQIVGSSLKSSGQPNRFSTDESHFTTVQLTSGISTPLRLSTVELVPISSTVVVSSLLHSEPSIMVDLSSIQQTPSTPQGLSSKEFAFTSSKPLESSLLHNASSSMAGLSTIQPTLSSPLQLSSEELLFSSSKPLVSSLFHNGSSVMVKFSTIQPTPSSPLQLSSKELLLSSSKPLVSSLIYNRSSVVVTSPTIQPAPSSPLQSSSKELVPSSTSTLISSFSHGIVTSESTSMADSSSLATGTFIINLTLTTTFASSDINRLTRFSGSSKFDLTTNSTTPMVRHSSTGTLNSSSVADLKSFTSLVLPTPVPTPTSAPNRNLTCQESPCNGQACINETSFGLKYRCICPYPTLGARCNTGIVIHFPLLTGNSYVRYDGVSFESTVNTIVLTFRTTTSSGLLVYAGHAIYQDFVQLVLVNEKVEFLFSTGDRTVNIKHPASIRLGDLITVIAKYDGRTKTGTLSINGTAPVSKQTSSSLNSIQISTSWYVGGIPASFRPVMTGNPSPFVNFTGCIRDLQVNEKPLRMLDAKDWLSIRECDLPACARGPCKNNASCVQNEGKPDEYQCNCGTGYFGPNCAQRQDHCSGDPCNGGICVWNPTGYTCLCQYGRHGITCNSAINITVPTFGVVSNYSSYIEYPWFQTLRLSAERLELSLQFKLSTANGERSKNGLIAFAGQSTIGAKSDDFLALGIYNNHTVLMYNLGGGVVVLTSKYPIPGDRAWHRLAAGRRGRQGYIHLDDYPVTNGNSPGVLVGLDVYTPLYIGGVPDFSKLPDYVRAFFTTGFSGSIHDMTIRTNQYHFIPLRLHLESKVASSSSEISVERGLNVGDDLFDECKDQPCANNGTCTSVGSQFQCTCLPPWKGVLCRNKVIPCIEYNPCSPTSECVAEGASVRCDCPLGKTGEFCDQDTAIELPLFQERSFLGLKATNVKTTTNLFIRFKSTQANGLLFYVSENIRSSTGDFFVISLLNRQVQVRFNLGGSTAVMKSRNLINLNTWHTVNVIRRLKDAIMRLDGNPWFGTRTSGSFTQLGVSSLFYVGGVPMLSSINSKAKIDVDSQRDFKGCFSALTINNQVYNLSTVAGRVGRNVGNCGRKCDHDTCANGATCVPETTSSTANYTCACTAGWEGDRCDVRVVGNQTSARFGGKSYVYFQDENKGPFAQTYIKLTFNTTKDGLLIWLGQLRAGPQDYLSLGIKNGFLHISFSIAGKSTEKSSDIKVNNGNRYVVTVHRFQTTAMVTLDKPYLAGVTSNIKTLNSYGNTYIGGIDGDVNILTNGQYNSGLVGCISDLLLSERGQLFNFNQVSLKSRDVRKCS